MSNLAWHMECELVMFSKVAYEMYLLFAEVIRVL